MVHDCYVFFETLGNKLKLNIISKLKHKPMIVTELSEDLNQERSKVSHALISLLDCEFVHVKKDGRKRIADNALVALCLLVAESNPREKNTIVKVVVNLINKRN